MKKITITAIVVVVAMLLLGVGKQRDKPTEFEEYKVREGDTLWNIAEDVTPEDRDLRYTVHIIEEDNSIENSAIYAGQVLEVPIWE